LTAYPFPRKIKIRKLAMQVSVIPLNTTLSYLPYRDRLASLLIGDLDFHGESSSYSSHSIHSFPAKFPPQLPRVFIESLTLPGDVVFDPMMGSGTTLLEASILDRHAIGTDIDPLALRICGTKLSVAALENIEFIGNSVVEKATNRLTNQPKEIETLLASQFDEESRKFVDYWFSRAAQLELVALLNEIQKVNDLKIRDFLLLNFSAIIIAKSGGVSLARDLAHTRPHRDLDKKQLSAPNEFVKRIKKNLKNISQTKPQGQSFLICEADAQHSPLSNNSVDLIVTSPPYASQAIDYMRAHKFSLVWFGYPISKLSDLRRKYIGGDTHFRSELLSMPEFTMQVIGRVTTADRKKGLALHRYYSEMKLAFGEMLRVLKPGKAAVVVVGNSILRGISTDVDRCLSEIGKQVGFELVQIGIRELDRNRRMLPVSKNKSSGANSQIEARMHEEYIIGFLKPGG
jgi:DNA modification methylase